jgi:hypothetical protein
MAQGLAEVGRSLLEGIFELVCYLYIWHWGLSREGRLLLSSAIWVLLISAVALFVEVLSLFVPWLHIQLPTWGKAIVVLAAAVLLFGRFRDLRPEKQRKRFALAVRLLFSDCSALRFDGTADDAHRLDDFIMNAMIGIRKVVGVHVSVNMNVMWLDPRDGVLRLALSHPAAHYDPELKMKLGNGAAGVALEEGVSVYVPLVKLRHGIKALLAGSREPNGGWQQQRDYDLAKRVYVPVSKEYEPYRSILSVPIIARSGPKGVLNVDSMRWNPFTDEDIDQAGCLAVAIGMAIDARDETDLYLQGSMS